MELIVDISSMASVVLVIILIFKYQEIINLKKFTKIIILLLCITVICANLLNYIDFYHGFIKGLNS